MNLIILRGTDIEKELFKTDTLSTELINEIHPCFDEKIKSIEKGKIVKAKKDGNYIFFIPDQEININEDFLIAILQELEDSLKNQDNIKLFIHFGGDGNSIDTKTLENNIKQKVGFLKDKNFEIITISFGKLSSEDLNKLKNTQSCIERIKKFLNKWVTVKEEKQKEEIREVHELAETVNNIVIENIKHLEGRIEKLKEEVDKLENINLENCKESLKEILNQLKEIIKINYDIYRELLEQLNKK